MDSSASSLPEIVGKARLHSQAVIAAQAGIEVAKGNLGVVGARRWPSLSLESSWMRSDNPVFVFGSLLDQQSFGAANFAVDQLNRPSYLTNIRNALDLRVPVFTAFESSTQREVLLFAVNRAQEQLDAEGEAVGFQAIEAYLDVLLQQALLEDVSARTASATGQIDDAKKLNEKGLVLGSDYHAALAIKSGLEARVVRIQNALRVASGRLGILLGDRTENIHVSGALSNPLNLSIKPDELQATAMSSRHDARSLDLQTKMAEANALQSRRSLFPKVDAFASVETDSESFDRNPSNRTIGVRSSFPIGDPSYSARKRAAIASANAAASEKSAAEDHIRLEILEAAGRYEAARDSAPALEEAARQAEKSLGLFRPLYREGRQSILDVTRAENDLAISRQALLENQREIYVAWARLLLVTGQLDDRAIKDLQSHLEPQP